MHFVYSLEETASRLRETFAAVDSKPSKEPPVVISTEKVVVIDPDDDDDGACEAELHTPLANSIADSPEVS